MRLCEDFQEDVISRFQTILDIYKNLNEECIAFDGFCSSDKDLSFEASMLKDFCENELWDKLQGVKDSILDKYYPIDYADEEEDHIKAGERYRDSKEAREKIFN